MPSGRANPRCTWVVYSLRVYWVETTAARGSGVRASLPMALLVFFPAAAWADFISADSSFSGTQIDF